MKGNLYKITNLVNGKIYIGKTYYSLQERFKLHIRSALREDRPNKTKFENAIIKYGANQFQIELIAQFEEGELEQKEIEYIQKYDSYRNGYNSTLGGEGSKTITKDTSDNIINMYYDYIPISKIALYIGVHVQTVRRILKNNTDYEPHVDNGKRVVMYNKDFEPECTFNSILEASEYIIGDVQHFRINIKKAFNDGIILYGHRWQLYTDLIYEDKIFKTKFERDAYINGRKAYQPEGKTYWVVDGIVEKFYGVKKVNRCIDCNCKISKKATRCKNCAQANNNKNKSKIAKPSNIQLEIDRKTMSIDDIAKKYNRSRGTICTWLYGR